MQRGPIAVRSKACSRGAQAGETNVLPALLLVLVVAAVLGVVLLVRLVHGAGPAASFSLGTVAPVPCPSGVGAPGCFKIDVTNVGGASARVICAVEGVNGAGAEFLKGSGVYVSAAAVAPQQTVPLVAKVQADADNVVSSPTFNCVASE